MEFKTSPRGMGDGDGIPAQESKSNTALLFAAAGEKCLAYAGVLEVLNEAGILTGIKEVYGSDTGAIVAALFAFGRKPVEIREFLEKNLCDEVMQDARSKCDAEKRLKTKMGCYKGNKFRKALDDEFIKKPAGQWLFETRDPTFGELKAKRDIKLVICAADITRNRIVIFDYISSANMPVSDAVRASMSIPYIFKRFAYGTSQYMSPILMDGYAYPSSLVPPTLKVIGIAPNPCSGSKPFMFKDTTKSDLYNLTVHVIFESLLDTKLSLARPDISIILPANSQYYLFDITDEAKKYMYDAGRDAAHRYLRKPFSSEGYCETPRLGNPSAEGDI